jgi:hypothetical protein
MANCINRSLPEFIELQKETGIHPGILAAKIGVWQDKNSSLEFPTRNNLTMNKRLEGGFLKDFNVDVKQYESIKDALGHNSTEMVDLVSKFIAIEEGGSLDKSTAFVAYKMLGKQNSKLTSDLKRRVHSWSKYKEKFDFHRHELFAQVGFIEDSTEWKAKVRDKVIIDFLAETIVKYNENPVAFERESESRQWTQDDFTFFKKLILALKQMIVYGFGVNLETKATAKRKLTNLSTQIAHEVLTQEYDILDYNLAEGQIQKYYEETIASDSFAKEVVEYFQNNRIVLTGSLALRKAGTVFRTATEALHDLDFVVPFELNKAPVNKSIMKQLMHLRDINLNVPVEKRKRHKDWTYKKAEELVIQLQWFKKFKAAYPNYKVLHGFYGGEHASYQSFTITGVIDGKYYDNSGKHEEAQRNGTTKMVKHKKGEWIKDTGYIIDHFVRLEPQQEEHEDYFKLWKEIMIAKLKMGRAKDLVDFKHFVPFTKSRDSYNFYYDDWVYQAGNTAIRGKKELTLKEQIEESPLSKEAQEVDKMGNFIGAFIEKLQSNLGLSSEQVQQVTEEEAKELTVDAINPWAGQPGFYHNGTVYLVKGKIDYTTAFHEFAHPLVRAIAADNSKLFNKIYSDIISTPQGMTLLKEALNEYSWLTESDQQVREEVIVKAMTYVATNQGSANIESRPSNALLAAIKKIIYAIKQALRKIGGKSVDPKNLSINTTAKELADMMINDTWNLNMDLIEESDIVAYLGDKKKALEELEQKVDRSASLAMYNTALKAANTKLLEMEKAKEWSDIIEVLTVSGDQTSTLRSRDTLRGLSSKEELALEQERAEIENLKDKKEKAKKLIALESKEDEFFKKRIRAVYTNLVEVESEVSRINEHLGFLAEEPDQQSAYAQLEVYKLHLQASKQMLEDLTQQLMEAGMPTEPGNLLSDVITISKNVDNANDNVKKIYQAALSESFSKKFNTGMSGQVDKWREHQKMWRNQKAGKSDKRKAFLDQRIADTEEKIKSLQSTPETMLEYMLGQRGDINQVSMLVENFIASQDKSISTFANYIKDTNTKVRTELHKGRNYLLSEMNKHLDELGVRPDKVTKFSEQFLFEDWTTKMNYATGEIEDYKVQTLLNPWQNFKRDQGILEYKESEAYKAWQKKPNSKTSKAYSDISELRRAHSKLYFKGRFVDAYYHADDELLAAKYDRKLKDGTTETIDIGVLAKQEVREKYDVVLQLQSLELETEIEVRTNIADVKAALAEYKKLFSLVDDYGNRKEDEELEKAKLLISNRAKKRDFYEYIPIRNAFESALDGQKYAIEAELASLVDEFPPETIEYKNEVERRLQMWINDNVRFKAKDEYYTLRGKLYDQLNEIMPESDDSLSEERELLMEALQGRKDDDGQPVGVEMTERLLGKIKEIQKTLIDAQALKPKLTELFPNDQDTIDTIVAIFGALQNLQKTEATTYYLDIVNAHFRRIRKEEGELNPAEITLADVDAKFSDPTFVKTLRKDAEFSEWFDANHILKTKKTGKKTTIQVYERIKAWSITKPAQEEHIEQTKIYNAKGELERTIEGLPKMMYYKRQVKAEYVTGYDEKTGEVDIFGRYTNQGFQIPKSLEEMRVVQERYSKELEEHNQKIKKVLGKAIPFDHYINHEFLNLQKTDDARFKLLETFRRFHYNSQDGLDKNKTLGDELPRLRKDKYLYLTSGNSTDHVIETAKMHANSVAQHFGTQQDDPESGVNYEEQDATSGTAFQQERKSQVPIRGKYNIDFNQVAPDVVKALFVYYQSAEQNKVLTSMLPMADAMKEMAENAPLEIIKTQKKKVAALEKSAVKNNITYGKKKNSKDNQRKKLIDGMVEVLFEGKGLVDEGYFTTNDATAVKTVNNLMGLAAHSFFALDLTSGLKNFYGAQFQIALEAAGGKYYGYRSFQAGRPWAMKAMTMVSLDVDSQTNKSLEVQIIDIFDAIQGRFEEKFGESPSRSVARSAVGLSWMTSPRKWLETEATLQIFSAIMRDTKVKQVVNGKETEINYIDAWELDANNHIKLKDGIDKKWDMGGEMFLKTTNTNHEVSNFLQGAYSKADKGIVNRYLAYRIFGSLKNYFAKMFMHRYAAGGLTDGMTGWLHPQERMNLATGQMHMGFYWEFMNTLVKSIESRGMYISSMTKEEKRRTLLAPLDFVKQLLIAYLFNLILQSFGTDDDDSKKWSKVSNQTGVLPIPGLANPKYANRFDTFNWVKAHALLTLMGVEQEVVAFSPINNKGIQHMYETVTVDQSIALAGSATALGSFMYSFYQSMDLWGLWEADPKAFYKKDSGGTRLKQKGTPKWMAKAAKLGIPTPYTPIPLIPVSTKFGDPVAAAANQDRYR